MSPIDSGSRTTRANARTRRGRRTWGAGQPHVEELLEHERDDERGQRRRRRAPASRRRAGRLAPSAARSARRNTNTNARDERARCRARTAGRGRRAAARRRRTSRPRARSATSARSRRRRRPRGVPADRAARGAHERHASTPPSTASSRPTTPGHRPGAVYSVRALLLDAVHPPRRDDDRRAERDPDAAAVRRSRRGDAG